MLGAGKLLDLARECLEAGIAGAGPGKRFGDVGAAIQELAEHHGYPRAGLSPIPGFEILDTRFVRA